MFISDAEWQQIRHRSQLPAMQPAMTRLRREVATFLAQPLQVQAEPGGYYHDYFCPDHGVELTFDAAAPTVHRCPVDGALVAGARFDAAWRWFVNNRLAEGAYRLAILGRLDGRVDYHARIAQILLDYANRYADYAAFARTVANPGVATYTTLDEAVWILPLAWAFAIIRDELAAVEQQTITRQLFRPVAEHLVRHHFRGIHNFACWHNAAICTIGLLVERDDLVDFAIHGPFGFEVQLRDGVLADGLWYEGSFSYHFYTVAALLAQLKATAHRPDLDLRNRPKVREMLVAPIRCAYPDGTLPATNDCWYFTGLIDSCCHGVPPAPAFYEVAAAWYDEPRFQQVLARAYQHGPRDTLDALLYGAAHIAAQGVDPLPSDHLPATGYAILRGEGQPVDEQRYLLLKYGPHGGGHGHPDKLNLIVYANGVRHAPDLGTPGYGLDLFESWYRQTASHNTVTIDGQSQPAATGLLTTFRGEGAFQVADATIQWKESEGLYNGVTMRRTILARPTYFLDLFLVETPQPRRIDWFFRNGGALHATLPLVAYPQLQSEGAGYGHIAQSQRATVSGAFTVDWQWNGVGLRLAAAGADKGVVLTGCTPGNPPTEQATTLIQRQQGTQALFLTLFQPFRGQPTVCAVEWRQRDLFGRGWAGCRVDLGSKAENWLIRLAPSGPEPDRPIEAQGQDTFVYDLKM